MDIPVCFVGVRVTPTKTAVGKIYRISRIVTLPDYQGLGVGVAVMNFIGEMYAEQKWSLRITTAHPGVIRALAKHPQWRKVDIGRHAPHTNKAMRQTYRPAILGTFRYVGHH